MFFPVIWRIWVAAMKSSSSFNHTDISATVHNHPGYTGENIQHAKEWCKVRQSKCLRFLLSQRLDYVCYSISNLMLYRSLKMKLTSGFFIVGGHHHRELQRRRIRQTGERLLQACSSEEVLLLLITPLIHHSSGDMGDYNKLQRRSDMSDSTVLQHPKAGQSWKASVQRSVWIYILTR